MFCSSLWFYTSTSARLGMSFWRYTLVIPRSHEPSNTHGVLSTREARNCDAPNNGSKLHYPLKISFHCMRHVCVGSIPSAVLRLQCGHSRDAQQVVTSESWPCCAQQSIGTRRQRRRPWFRYYEYSHPIIHYHDMPTIAPGFSASFNACQGIRNVGLDTCKGAHG